MAASTVRASLPEWDSFFPAEPVGSPCSYRKVQGGLPGVVFCSHVMPFCKGQEFFHNTHSRLVISAQGAYLARPLRKDFIHGVMEPSRNACQPSTVYSRFTGRRPPFTLQPGLATTFIHFSLPQPYLSKISVPQPRLLWADSLWHRHTKPREPLTKPRCRPLFEHAGVDNCWEISSARQ